MLKFLKNNLISILIASGAVSALSYAATYNRPYNSTYYTGGTKAVGPVVNAEFQAITDWINGGNIASGNIAALGVYGYNLFSNFLITDSSSLFTNTGATPQQITNFTGSITTSGRPVALSIQGTGTTYMITGSSTLAGLIYSDDLASRQSYLAFYRDGSIISQQRINAGGKNDAADKCSAFSHIDFPVAGAYTYQVKIFSAPGFTATVAGCRLVIREL